MSEPASIPEAIAAEGGRVTFARFMELALTHPSLGYYCRTDRILGHGGDFNTAPGLSPFFNRTVARLVTDLLDAALGADGAPSGDGEAGRTGRLSVVELGGGEGHLAGELLSLWQEARPGLKDLVAYRAVEVSGGLQCTQAAALTAFTVSGWDVAWGPSLAEACAGTRPAVIVGNEFVDTLPVHLVRVDAAGLGESYVRAGASGLEQFWGPVTAEAVAELETLFGTVDPARLAAFTEDGVIEVFPGMDRLLAGVAAVMPSGSFVNIDYGEWFPGVPYEGESWGLEGRRLRRQTVRGYFKQRLVTDVLARPGRQDLTADVDFAALDLHSRRHGFETVLFGTMSALLRAGGAEDVLEALAAGDMGLDDIEADRQATVLRNLLDERDLGGAFKLMVQVRE